MKLRIIFLLLVQLSFIFCSCNKQENKKQEDFTAHQEQLKEILVTQNLNQQQRYTIINQMANNLLANKDYQGVILFLTDWVESHPDDLYNSYWLLMTAFAYLSTGAEPDRKSVV